MVSVEIKYATFETSSHQKQLFGETASDTVIYQAAMELFDELWDGRPIRLLGNPHLQAGERKTSPGR